MADINSQKQAAPATDTVKVRVTHGRLLVAREMRPGSNEATELFADPGQVVDVPKAWADAMLKRSFDGYPGPNGTPGKLPGVIRDCPFELA